MKAIIAAIEFYVQCPVCERFLLDDTGNKIWSEFSWSDTKQPIICKCGTEVTWREEAENEVEQD